MMAQGGKAGQLRRKWVGLFLSLVSKGGKVLGLEGWQSRSRLRAPGLVPTHVTSCQRAPFFESQLVKATTPHLLIPPDSALWYVGHPQDSVRNVSQPRQGQKDTASFGVAILGAPPCTLGPSMPAFPGLLAGLANSG